MEEEDKEHKVSLRTLKTVNAGRSAVGKLVTHNPRREKCFYLEYFKTGNVQDADEGGTLPFGPVQSFVDAVDEPAEQTFIRGFRQSLHSKVSLEDKWS